MHAHSLTPIHSRANLALDSFDEKVEDSFAKPIEPLKLDNALACSLRHTEPEG
jgi:hypothetical protein